MISLHKCVGFRFEHQGQLNHHNLLVTVEDMPETTVGLSVVLRCSEHLLKSISLIFLRLKDLAPCSGANSTPADLLTPQAKGHQTHQALRRADGVSEPPGQMHRNCVCLEVDLEVWTKLCNWSPKPRLMGKEAGQLRSSQTSGFNESHRLHKEPQRRVWQRRRKH